MWLLLGCNETFFSFYQETCFFQYTRQIRILYLLNSTTDWPNTFKHYQTSLVCPRKSNCPETYQTSNACLLKLLRCSWQRIFKLWNYSVGWAIMKTGEKPVFEKITIPNIQVCTLRKGKTVSAEIELVILVFRFQSNRNGPIFG